jgi:oligopeptidase A
VGKEPSLMTFDEITILFHKFGYGLQYMLTKIDYPGASGINNVECNTV